MAFKTDSAKEYLKKHDIKPSTIRIKVLQYLKDNKYHPTVDDIYKELIENIPTLSKTSIYNTLELFIEKNIVNLVSIDDKESRYDIDTSRHGHFKCEICNKIYDFNVDISRLNEKDIMDFIIKKRKIYYEGICKNCLNKSNH